MTGATSKTVVANPKKLWSLLGVHENSTADYKTQMLLLCAMMLVCDVAGFLGGLFFKTFDSAPTAALGIQTVTVFCCSTTNVHNFVGLWMFFPNKNKFGEWSLSPNSVLLKKKKKKKTCVPEFNWLVKTHIVPMLCTPRSNFKNEGFVRPPKKKQRFQHIKLPLMYFWLRLS